MCTGVLTHWPSLPFHFVVNGPSVCYSFYQSSGSIFQNHVKNALIVCWKTNAAQGGWCGVGSRCVSNVNKKHCWMYTWLIIAINVKYASAAKMGVCHLFYKFILYNNRVIIYNIRHFFMAFLHLYCLRSLAHRSSLFYYKENECICEISLVCSSSAHLEEHVRL